MQNMNKFCYNVLSISEV